MEKENNNNYLLKINEGKKYILGNRFFNLKRSLGTGIKLYINNIFRM
ncbi:hypothetical protein [Candidatus Karelsulcia muelleri]